MVDSPLNEALGISVPIMCAGMGGITGAELAAAVSEAGGIGTIGAIGLGPKGLRNEIQRIKKLTTKPTTICCSLRWAATLVKPTRTPTAGPLPELLSSLLPL